VRRLGLIFRELDPTGFTAEEFARGYNIQPRSARRLIALLRARGLVQECGLEAGDGVGRPRHVYRLLLDRLTGSEGGNDRQSDSAIAGVTAKFVT
jgi:predicted ArsR family transcriptional regulator